MGGFNTAYIVNDSLPAQNGYAKEKGIIKTLTAYAGIPFDFHDDADYTNIDLTSLIQQGYYKNDTGAFVSTSSWRAVIYPCNPGDVMRCTAKVSGGTTAMALFLDASNNVIGFLNKGTNDTNYQNFTNYPFLVPAGASKVAISGLPEVTLNLAKANTNVPYRQFDILNIGNGDIYYHTSATAFDPTLKTVNKILVPAGMGKTIPIQGTFVNVVGSNGAISTVQVVGVA